ncbi:hypothetical protein Q7P36_006467 [Cladosporium allicinum]
MKGIHRNDGEDDVSTSTASFPSHRHIPDDRNSHGIEDTTNGKTWGFIGLGNIGYPMAVNLREKIPASDTLMVLDVNARLMQCFVDDDPQTGKSDVARIQVARNARELAEKSSVIITSLPSPKVVQTVYNEILQDKALPALETERLFIDTSTIDPPTSKSIAILVRTTNNGTFVDAPVSGGVIAARTSTLTFMFGAPPSNAPLLLRIKNILSLMGTKTLHMGDQGTGVASKLANNYILSITNIAVAEALNMGQKCGLDLKVLSEMIATSTGRCWPIESNNPVPGVDETAPASNGYEPGGTVGIIRKDLGLAVAGAEAVGAYLALAGRAGEVYEEVEGEYGGKDLSVVYRWLQDKN